jgi:hypothetical protein
MSIIPENICGQGTFLDENTGLCEIDMTYMANRLHKESLLTFTQNPNLSYTFSYHNYDSFNYCEGDKCSPFIQKKDILYNSDGFSIGNNCTNCKTTCNSMSGLKETICDKCQMSNVSSTVMCEDLRKCRDCKEVYHPIYPHIKNTMCDSCMILDGSCKEISR